MHKVLKLILFLGICCHHTPAGAQKKYAVVIGVDDYFDRPGVKHSHSLSGCVNDGNSMKELLIDRFGFEKGNIHSLYNTDVTRKNVIDLMHRMLLLCREGDALVFYYSGHGVWMT